MPTDLPQFFVPFLRLAFVSCVSWPMRSLLCRAAFDAFVAISFQRSSLPRTFLQSLEPNERSCGSVRGAISDGRPYRDLFYHQEKHFPLGRRVRTPVSREFGSRGSIASRRYRCSFPATCPGKM